MRNLKRFIVSILFILSVIPFTMAEKPTASTKLLTNHNTTANNLKKVYVPVSELETILQQDKQGVLLPKEEFDKLLKGISKEGNAPDHLPRGILVKGVEYQARIDKKQLVISATMQLRQYVEDWQSLPLPFANLSLEKATLNGKPAQLGRDSKKNQLVLFSNQQGKTTLELELTTPLGTIGSDKIAAFHLSGAASGTLALTLPAGKYLFVDGLKVLRPAKVDQPANYQISVGGKQNIQLRISDEQKEQTTDSLLFASSKHGLYATPGEVTWQSLTTLQVYGKSLDQLTFEIPKLLEIVSVESTGLEMWELEDSDKNDDKTKVTLRYRQPFNGTRQVAFRGVLSTSPKEPWQVPTLILTNTTSHVGRILISKPTGVRLKLNKNEGTRQVSDPQTQALDSLAFDIWQEDFTLQFETQPRRRELRAALTTLVDINRNGLDLNFTASLATAFEPLFRLEITIPAEWTITDVRMNDKRVLWQTVPQEAGTHQIQVTLSTPLIPGKKQSFSLVAHRDLEQWPPVEKPEDFDLPEVLLPQASIVEGTLALRTEEIFEVIPVETEELEPAELKLPGILMGWRYQNLDYSGLVEVTQKPLRISVQTISSTRLDPRIVRSSNLVMLEVAGSGTQSVQIALPEEVQEDIRFQVVRGSTRIVEQTASKPRKGERIWTLQFDRRFRGRLQLAVELTIPREDDEQKGESHALPNLRVIGAERQNGFLAIIARDEQQMLIDAIGHDGQPLRAIDPADFPTTIRSATGRMIAAFRYIIPGYRLSLQETRFDRAAVPTAICQLGNHQTQLDATGVLLHRFEYQFQAIGVQSLQVQLPEGLELWSAVLDGQPIEVRRDKGLLQIPLIATSQMEHVLQLTASSTGDPLRSAGSITEQPPQLSILDGSGNQQPLEVLEQNWKVHYPPETMITESNGLFHPTEALQRQGLLNQLRNSFHFVPTAQLWTHTIMVCVVIVLIAIIVRAFKRWRFIGLLGVGMLAGLFLAITLVLMVVSPGLQSERKTARYNAESDELESMSRAGELFGEYGSHDDARFNPGEKKSESDGDNDRNEKKAVTKSEATKTAAPSTAGLIDADPKNISPADESPGDELFLKIRQTLTVHQQSENVNKRGARLSVAVQFQPPAEMRSIEFHHVGEGTLEQAGLQLQYANKSAANNVFWAILAGVLLSFWLLRKRGWKCLTFCVIVGLVLPLALFTFAPGQCLAVLDGIFFGTLAALTFGVILRVVLYLKQNLTQPVGKVLTGNVAGWMIGLCLIFAGQNLLAQKQTKMQRSNPPRPTASKKYKARFQKAATAYVEPAKKEPAKEESIYYAYEEGKDPLAAKQVFVPYNIYRKMWDRAYPLERIETTAPIKGIVTAATYSATLVKGATGKVDRARVQGRIVLHSFRSKRITLALPVGRVSIQSALLDGKKAVLVANPQQKNQPLSVVVTTPGLHILDVSFDLAVKSNGAAGELTIPLHAIPSGRFSLTLPATDLEVRVNGGSENFRRETKEKITTVAIPVDKGGELRVAWQPRQQNGGANATIHAESASYLSVDDGGISMKSSYRFRVHQGSVKEILFAFPEEIKLRKITGDDVSGWEIAGKGKNRTLKVFLRRAVTKSTTLYFDQFLVHDINGEESSFALPQFYPLQVARDVGQIGIAAQRHFQIQGKATTGASQINLRRFQTASWMKANSTKPLKLAYRSIARPFDLRLTLSRRQAEQQAKAEHLLLVGRRKIHIASNLAITSQEVPQSRFVFNLPDDFLLLDVKATGLRDWYVVEGKKRRRRKSASKLVIELNKPYIGRVDILLSGTIPHDSEEEEVTMAVPAITEVDRLISEMVVRFDETVKAKVADEGDWKSITPQKVSPWLCETGHRAQFAFRSTEASPGEVEFELSQPEPKYSAAVVTVLSVTDTFLHYSMNVKWNIQQGSLDSLSFLTEKHLKDRLAVQARGVRHITSEETKSGQIRWTIYLHRPVQKQFFLTATATLPPAEGNVVTSPTLTVEGILSFEEEVVTSTYVKQRHYVVLVNQSHFQLSRKEKNVEVVSAEILPVSISKSLLDQAVEIVRQPDQGENVEWQIQRFSQQQSAPAVINFANLVTVLSRNGSWKTEVTYNIRNRSRQFLPVQIPPESRLLSVFVKGKPSRPSTTTFQSVAGTKEKKEEAVLLIPLPHSSNADPSFNVKLIVAGRLAKGALSKKFQLSGETVDLPQIHVYSTKKSKEYGISVSRSNWTVHVPKDFDASAIDDLDRNNLEESTREKSAIYQLKSLSREVDEMMSYSSGKPSSRTNRRTLSNLKELELSLENTSKGKKWGKDKKKTIVIVDGSESMNKQKELLRKLQVQQRKLEGLIKAGEKTDRNKELVTDLRSHSEGEQKQELQNQARGQYAKNILSDDGKPSIVLDERNSGSLQKSIDRLTTSNSALQGRANDAKFSNEPEGKPGLDSKIMGGRGLPDNNLRYQQRAQSETQLGNFASKQTKKPSYYIQKGPSDFFFADDVTKKNSTELFGTVTGLTRKNTGADVPASPEEEAESEIAKWSSAGGLSLEINIPVDGQVFTFSKVGGEPRLAINLRPAKVRSGSLAFLWSFIWLAGGAAVLWVTYRTTTPGKLFKVLPMVFVVLGLLIFFTLPVHIGWIGFLFFCLGAIIIGVNRSRVKSPG